VIGEILPVVGWLTAFPVVLWLTYRQGKIAGRQEAIEILMGDQ